MENNELAASDNTLQNDNCNYTDTGHHQTNRIPTRKRIFTLTFGILALLLAMGAATFAAVMNLAGISVVFTDAGLIPMASCLVTIISFAVPAIVFSVLSQKLGIVCGLNKVSLALSTSSAIASSIIFFTLSVLVILNNAGVI